MIVVAGGAWPATVWVLIRALLLRASIVQASCGFGLVHARCGSFAA
jgi:hypothetical protein